MKKFFILVISIIYIFVFFGCQKQEQPKREESVMSDTSLPSISERVKAYAPTIIKTDLSKFTDRQQKLVHMLVEAGKIADEIFWEQTSYDAVAVRDSLEKLNAPENKDILEYAMINYGPYDRIYGEKRFVGNGPGVRPPGGTYYPADMAKTEFEDYIKAHPEQKDELESQYTVVVRDGSKLKAVPFHIAYPLAMKLADKLDEAAEYADNPSFKNYLKLRAEAIRTDNYFKSDMAWMDVKNNNIDVIIGPIENYEDAMFNYKTAYEAVVMIKDEEATKEFEMYKKHVLDFEMALPYDKKYIRNKVGEGSQINFEDVVYFGGDCQKGIKTIAASLPNDPKVREAKGGKNSMFKNMMEAKLEKIVVPIGERILDPSLLPYVDKKAFITLVTLHEVSHTLGRSTVYGNDKLTIRKALMDRFSAIEEAKADVLGLYNHQVLRDMNIYNDEYVKKAVVTYIAGLYRSIRFGTKEAHGKANLIELNFLIDNKAIVRNTDGKLSYDPATFFSKVAELAKTLLTIEAQGDYNAAVKLMDKYCKMTDEQSDIIKSLKDIPRDIDTKYVY